MLERMYESETKINKDADLIRYKELIAERDSINYKIERLLINKIRTEGYIATSFAIDARKERLYSVVDSCFAIEQLVTNEYVLEDILLDISEGYEIDDLASTPVIA
jgi:hypothetical protein